MGLITTLFTALFGGERNVIRETAEVFRVNAESADERGANAQAAALAQMAAEYGQPRRNWFDGMIDGLNRLPRPAMAFGVVGLLVAAMVDPIWFAERMTGLALVPEPLWWLLGVVVSFYFGARQQVKGQEFQKSIAETMSRVPQVVENLGALRKLRADSPGVADSGADAELGLRLVSAGVDGNAAVEEWRRTAA
ncbi:holin family protein [Pseudooceanicola sp. 200-1SW]|uniref:holin family protein n=1 Tax=Pseudooceanicola sp. 200-1SW TaxID=3425949 RepID=UPI003D7FC461